MLAMGKIFIKGQYWTSTTHILPTVHSNYTFFKPLSLNVVQKMEVIDKKRIRGWEGCLEPMRVVFQEKSHLNCQALSFLLEKLILILLPADMIPRLQETSGMKRSRWTVWGFYHWRSDWIPQFRDESFFFSWASRAISSRAGPVIIHWPLVVLL